MSPHKHTTITRILEVSPYAPPHVGGIEYVVHHLCQELSRDPVLRVTWCAAGMTGTLPDDGVRRVPMKTTSYVSRLTNIPYPLWSAASLWKLFREVRNHDVVHAHDHVKFGCVAALFFALLLGKKRVVTLHGPLWIDIRKERWLHWLSRFVQQTLSRFFLPRCHAITAVSETAKRTLQDFLALPCTVIPNGVDVRTFHHVTRDEQILLRKRHGISESSVTLLFVGRFVKNKGMETIRAIAMRRPEWQWQIVGAPNGPDVVDPATWDLPNVRVRGVVDNRKTLAELYQAADALIAPSSRNFEGFPLVVIEALACGLPPIITKPDTYDGIDPASLTVIDDPADVDAWIRGIENVVGRGERAHADMAALGWTEIARRYAAVFDGLSRAGPEAILGA